MRRMFALLTLTWFLITEAAIVKLPNRQVSSFLVRKTIKKSGPATLSEYCAGGGDGAEFAEGAKIEADWKGYGIYYPGRVGENKGDGKLLIKYDDGFDEEIVDEDGDGSFSKVRPAKDSKPKPKKTVDDAACEMKEFVDKVEDKVQKVGRDLSLWVASKRAAQKGKKLDAGYVPPAPKAEPLEIGETAGKAGAPAPAAYAAAPPATAEEYVIPDDASPDQKSELKQLIEELRNLDEKIQALASETDFNDLALQKAMGLDGKVAKRSDPVDALIAKYKERIRERRAELERLKAKKDQQEQALAIHGGEAVPLDAIAADVEDLEVDLAKVREKRDKLEKQGKLDQELGHLVNGLLKAGANLKAKVATLMEADRAAKATKEGEVGEMEDAAEAAALDTEVMAAAEDLEKDLTDLNSQSKKMETDLHPHGEKWWRYRYEHSFVEALVMVIVTILMVFWEKVVAVTHHRAYGVHAHEHLLTQGTMIVHWVEHFALELMSCLLVFITVWALAQSYFFELLPIYVKESKALHLPKTGEEYARLAMDICGILFTAVVFYYWLVFGIVQAAQKQISAWGRLQRSRSVRELQPHGRRASVAVAAFTDDFSLMTNFFMHQIKQNPVVFQECLEESWKELESSGAPTQNLEKMTITNFPFWKYIRVCVRGGLDGMTIFGPPMWILIVVTFVILMALHYYAHMGYVRITIGFLAVLFIVSGIMVCFMHSVDSHMKEWTERDEKDEVKLERRGQRGTAVMVTETMQFVLFFLCYAATRVACQRWMWEMHFYPVLGITIFTIFFVFFFVLIVAPIIPVFAASMGMPPYLDLSDTPEAKEALTESFKIMYGMEDVEAYLRDAKE